MCGIVGSVIKARNGFTKTTEDIFFQMLFADTLRGDDSTGIITVHNDSGFGIAKEGYSAPLVIDSFQGEEHVKDMFNRGKAYIGHNRKKTIGAVSDETSHPFVVDDVFAMVHNGTLRNHKELADTVVDSEALAIHLSKVLVKDFDKEAFEESIGKVNGAYAISAYNQDANCIYITRNTERPLSYVETKEGWFWASEMGLLMWIVGRNGLVTKDTEFKVLKPNTLLTIDLDTNSSTELEYVPKKAMPVIPATTPKKATIPVGIKSGNRATKNQFKRDKRRLLGSRLFFYADDYIEKNYPRTLMEGETQVFLLGEAEELEYDNTLQASFDISTLKNDKEDFTECFYTALVTNVEFDKVTGWVTILCDEAKVVSHTRVVAPVIDAKWIKDRMDKDEAATIIH